MFYDNLPPVNGETRFYYVITAFDNQGNQSYPSEEIVCAGNSSLRQAQTDKLMFIVQYLSTLIEETPESISM